MTEVEQWADWCASDGSLSICGTRMTEYSRESIGMRWCFRHRKREPFYWVVMVPDGLSYYGPSAEVVGPTSECTDLFPGWSRGWADE